MATSTIVQQQTKPIISAQANQWSTGICDCFDDLPDCCCAFWCFECFACFTAQRFGECLCLPLLDWTACVPPISLATRVAVRHRYGIQGSICGDCLYVSFCNVCSWCQMSREMKRRQQTLTIITTQSEVMTSQYLVVTSHPGTSGVIRPGRVIRFQSAQVRRALRSAVTMAMNVVIQQAPVVTSQSSEWSTGLFDCFKDMKVCCLFYWCFPCMACRTAQKFGECLCLPLIDTISQAVMIMLDVPIIVPAIGLSTRVAVRHKYGIPGTIAGDCVQATFCSVCSWCQIARELDHRSKPLKIINFQPAPVMMQPVAMTTPPTFMPPPPGGMTAPPTFMAPPPTVTASAPSFEEDSHRDSRRHRKQTEMGVYSWLLLLLSVCWLLPPRGCHGSRILVVPVDGSHWVNMEVLVRELHSRGHHLTVLRPSNSWFIRESAPHYDSITVMMGESEVGLGFFHGMVGRVLEARKRGPVLRFLHQQKELAALLRTAHRATCRMVTTLLEDCSLVAQLKDTQFDLMLTDPAMPTGTLLAHYLHLPLVYNARWTSFGRYATNFLQERLVILPLYRELLRLHFPPGADLPSMQRAADLWLMRTDFVFDFPRPTMPNVVYIGGFQCRPARPLPPELEEFMQSSGEHGVVVMSLGTLISALPMEITERIAAALARLPQKVVWRYVGKKPSTLGNNTLLLDWLPQNDLLGHPKTRAFLAHGGTNGLYEAIYHGVPVLGLPLLFDQFDNVLRLQVRGAARALEAATLSTEEVLEALRGVLKNPSYRRAMQGLSRLHRDRPLSPLHSAIFWIEYVIRHRGATHLRSAAYHLPWYSYHSLDVAALLLALAGASLWAVLTACRLLSPRLVPRHRKT
ncbi:hypothetical protein MATL_G00045930 [Megalops atlanticus]|uniref:UDP-glycosyltransferases domain-containing protein n=1 Tax=Megalops atlanticus TaxID=7932 RepID=A0A9D3Q9H9_MEGAT|nr:hypothetical protein MATL_G00045930 [Megalops atlanticus]